MNDCDECVKLKTINADLLAACEAAEQLIDTLDREIGFRSFMMPIVLMTLRKAIAQARGRR